MIRSNIYEFSDLYNVRKNTHCFIISTLKDILINTQWQKQYILNIVMDICHLTAPRLCHIGQNVSSIPRNRYDEVMIFGYLHFKKIIGGKMPGGGTHPLVFEGYNSINQSINHFLLQHKHCQILCTIILNTKYTHLVYIIMNKRN